MLLFALIAVITAFGMRSAFAAEMAPASNVSQHVATAKFGKAPVKKPVSKTRDLGVTDRQSAVTQNRAMWLWNWSSNDEVIRFAKAQRVNEIFTYAIPGFSRTSEKDRLAELSTMGRANGIRMWAMGGDPSWVTNPTAATDWIREARASGLFSGIHLEIEAHSVANYSANKAATHAAYLRLLDQCNAAAGPEQVELSIPWWYGELKVGNQSLEKLALQRVDRATIVTFNRSVAGINDNARSAAKVATALGKPFRFASETNLVEADWISFYGQSASQMRRVQNAVSATWASNSLYLGFAVEEYEGWTKLPA